MRRTLRKRGDFIASDVYTPPAESAAGASSGASASQGEGGVGVGGKGTLLSKIFGAYSIQMYWHTEYFCVMENAFPPKGACLICSPFSSLYFTVLFLLTFALSIYAETLFLLRLHSGNVRFKRKQDGSQCDSLERRRDRDVQVLRAALRRWRRGGEELSVPCSPRGRPTIESTNCAHHRAFLVAMRLSPAAYLTCAVH